MRLYESVVRPLAFMLSPETAHNIGMRLIARGLMRCKGVSDPRLEQSFFGCKFPNPLGLAAGFDKNALAVDRWQGLGFGFAEVGTITFHAQPGNPKPRLFRLPQHRAIINRMGFNNDGATAVSSRLRNATTALPVGINLGKSKITELDKAAEDYRESYKLLHSLGAYYVVNVSSPNTPGLRSLQERGPLIEIVSAIQGVDRCPLFIKIAPDLETAAVDDVLEVVHEMNLAGVIATNTTISREGISGPNSNEGGGLSGAPVFKRSNELLAYLASSCPPDKVLIGVGGIFTGTELFEKISLGAHLAQIYTGWIYGGPGSVPRILGELLALMDQRGFTSLDEIRASRNGRRLVT